MSLATDRAYLAVDYGRRRIGLAKSDPSGTIASALDTIEVKSSRQALEVIAKLIAEYEPNGIVVGYPLHESGQKSEMCREIDTFIDELRGFFKGTIHRVDEYGSSEEAAGIIHAHGKRTGADKKRVDRLAAVVILQRFLDETFGR